MRSFALAVLIVLLVGSGTAARGQSPIFMVGVVEDAVRIPDDELAYERMKLVKDAGFNAVKITVPWTPTQFEVLNEEARVCAAARAAHQLGLVFILNIIPGQSTGYPGLAPLRPKQLKFFATTAGAYLSTLKRLCVPEEDVFYFEIGNEPNSSTFFMPQQDKDGEWVAPLNYTRMLAYAYDSLKADARKENVRVIVIGGAVASKRSPLGFIRQMGEAKRQLGISGPIMDWFSYHPYGSDSTEPPDTVHPDGRVIGLADYDQLAETLERSLGRVPPILYSEHGIESTIPPAKEYLYWGHGPNPAPTVPEKQQARFYNDAVEMACRQGTRGYFSFKLFDDPQMGSWQSGLHYSNGGNDATPFGAKASLALFREARQKTAESGGCG